MNRAWLWLGTAAFVGCSHVPLFSGKNYYKLVETRSGNQRFGQTARETRELYCPSNRLHDSEDPATWSDQELFQRLNDKVCLRVICRTDQTSKTQCATTGDAELRPDLERMRSSGSS